MREANCQRESSCHSFARPSLASSRCAVPRSAHPSLLAPRKCLPDVLLDIQLGCQHDGDDPSSNICEPFFGEIRSSRIYQDRHFQRGLGHGESAGLIVNQEPVRRASPRTPSRSRIGALGAVMVGPGPVGSADSAGSVGSPDSFASAASVGSVGSVAAACSTQLVVRVPRLSLRLSLSLRLMLDAEA
jgi:hypothetical protein